MGAADSITKPIVPVDCSALVPTPVEAELLGHVKGAFTGAVHSQQGFMEMADTGTLFLDETREFPTDFEAQLLGAIQGAASRRGGIWGSRPFAPGSLNLDSGPMGC